MGLNGRQGLSFAVAIDHAQQLARRSAARPPAAQTPLANAERRDAVAAGGGVGGRRDPRTGDARLRAGDGRDRRGAPTSSTTYWRRFVTSCYRRAGSPARSTATGSRSGSRARCRAPCRARLRGRRSRDVQARARIEIKDAACSPPTKRRGSADVLARRPPRPAPPPAARQSDLGPIGRTLRHSRLRAFAPDMIPSRADRHRRAQAARLRHRHLHPEPAAAARPPRSATPSTCCSAGPTMRIARRRSGENFRAVAETAATTRSREQIAIPLALRRERVRRCFTRRTTCCRRCRAAASVVTIHDCIHLMFPQYLPNRLAHLYARTSIVSAARRATRVLTVSESSKRDILRFVNVPPEKIDVIYNAIDERFGIEPREEMSSACASATSCSDQFVLYAGNIKPHKNLERLIEAFQLVRSRGLDDLKLLLIGDEISQVRRAAARGAPAQAAQARALPRLRPRGDAGRACTGWPACSSSLRSTKGSACRRSRRWPAARRSSRRTCRRCRRSSATRQCSSIRTIPRRSPTALPRC